MIDTLFLIKLFISFILGGLWVILATYLADRLGPRIGGLIAGLPSTILFGLLFIGWTQSTEAAVEATSVTPLIMGMSSLFLAVFVMTILKA